LHGRQDRLLDRLRAVRWCRLLQPLDDHAVLVHRSGRDLGPTDIDADADRRWQDRPLCAAEPGN
jgi:hypothetical protein